MSLQGVGVTGAIDVPPWQQQMTKIMVTNLVTLQNL